MDALTPIAIILVLACLHFFQMYWTEKQNRNHWYKEHKKQSEMINNLILNDFRKTNTYELIEALKRKLIEQKQYELAASLRKIEREIKKL